MPSKELAATEIDLEEIKKALEDESGYPFELEIARRVEASEYYVEPNYSFEDQDTGIARELDFHAVRVESISERKGEFIFVVILGSCKDNKNPYVFFTRELFTSGIMLTSDVPIAGCPLEIYDEIGDNWKLEDYLALHKFLHIGGTDIVSSQFCELKQRKGKWEIQSETIFKNAIVPLFKALSADVTSYNEEHIPSSETEGIDYQIYYPLIVLNGPLLQYHVPPEGPSHLEQSQHIVVVRPYESRTVKCRYAIDVIHESYLENYLKLIDKEVTKFTNLVRHHKKILTQSIRNIAVIEQKKASPKLV
jgi:hypothetical protein